jgi:hypothetical protein
MQCNAKGRRKVDKCWKRGSIAQIVLAQALYINSLTLLPSAISHKATRNGLARKQLSLSLSMQSFKCFASPPNRSCGRPWTAHCNLQNPLTHTAHGAVALWQICAFVRATPIKVQPPTGNAEGIHDHCPTLAPTEDRDTTLHGQHTIPHNESPSQKPTSKLIANPVPAQRSLAAPYLHNSSRERRSYYTSHATGLDW